MANSIETIETHCPASRRRDSAIDIHRQVMSQLQTALALDVEGIRALEGKCAAAYFGAWQGIALNWKGSRPVPDAWQSYTSRSSLANGSKPQNRCASHPINAMLNYAYAVKLAHLQIGALADGYDPTIGIMHHGRRGKPAFIFDLIEPERPLVDAAVLAFAKSRKFAADDFIIRPDGVCRLSPQLSRMVVSVAPTAE